MKLNDGSIWSNKPHENVISPARRDIWLERKRRRRWRPGKMTDDTGVVTAYKMPTCREATASPRYRFTISIKYRCWPLGVCRTEVIIQMFPMRNVDLRRCSASPSGMKDDARAWARCTPPACKNNLWKQVAISWLHTILSRGGDRFRGNARLSDFLVRVIFLLVQSKFDRIYIHTFVIRLINYLLRSGIFHLIIWRRSFCSQISLNALRRVHGMYSLLLLIVDSVCRNYYEYLYKN